MSTPGGGGGTAGLDDTVVSAVRREVRAGRLDQLVIDELTVPDLARISWSGGPSHVRSVGRALERAASGEVEYLVVRAPAGQPVAKVGIDYCAHAGAGTLWQLATAAELQGLGLGSRLIAEGERCIRRRLLRWAALAVGDDNPRARALYERLGYQFWRREPASWQRVDERGEPYLYETELSLLRKRL